MQTTLPQPDLRPDNNTELQAAFQLFSQMSDQLENSYRDLEQRVEELSQKLAAANSEKLRQLAEKEKLADRLEALHEAMPAAVIWVNQSQKILSANQTAKQIFKSDIVNKNWQQVLQKQFTFDGHELIGQDASVYSYNQKSLEHNQGQVIILTDITLSRDLQQSNYRQQRLAELGEITAGIAHQVRTPLSSALLSIGHLLHPSVDEDLRKKSVNRIKQNLHHLDHLVNDMLLYARDGEFDHNCISISALMHNLDIYLQQEKHPYVNFNFVKPSKSADNTVVSGSGDALLSVLISLVENASQLASIHSPVNIDIKLSEGPGKIEISVADNGPGLSPEMCEQVFKPFFTTKKSGTGLGLAISRSIIKAHQGQLIAVSQPGKGTEMKITLNKFRSEKFLQSNSIHNNSNTNIQTASV